MDTPEEAVRAEVNTKVEAVAATAAAQIDQAQKDAEAIARAAQQSEHVARVNELEGRIGQWQSETSQKLEAIQAETRAMIEASQASILSRLPAQQPVTTVLETPPLDTSPTVNLDKEGGEQESKSKPTERPGETRQEQVQARKRAVL